MQSEEKTLKDDAIGKLIADLMIQCGLGAVIAPIEPVSGGFMHRVYRVRTDSGLYAVKHLNTEIMRREGVHDNYKRAEEIECLLERENIPIVPAITVLGKKMQHIEGNYFYIFQWQNGHITDWNHISNEMCHIAGNILGRIHAIDPRNCAHKEPEVSKVNWQEYVRKANDEKSEIASVLADNVQLLIYAERELNMARAALPHIMCVSNGDMDPKNIMWDNSNPWVIDLECLDYDNPISHAFQLALQWAGITTCSIDIEKMTAFFDGYLAVYDNCFRAYCDVFGLAYTWVEWLAYNIQRALGACADETERVLGISEVRNTINRIKYIQTIEKEVKEALNSRLPKIEAVRYDNHDERICYYELLLENDITKVPQYELPKGFRFAAYTDGDRDAWIDIELSAKEFVSYEQGLEAWNRYYAAKLEELPNRMFFIETNEGEKIATATAFYNIYGRDPSNDGWLHWVAVKREYQGKGLSKPLITYVLRVMNQLGHARAKIPTQTNTWLACKVYMDLGFVPVEKNLAHQREGWKIIKALTGHSALELL
ncbi:MAG: GNAT family N-acetyltransferase [Lachnospiraceae bacterium]|nr:GNAT family N-acetyltransferase [Lachnospiraceae bacterium]